jgi:hypothetical protein
LKEIACRILYLSFEFEHDTRVEESDFREFREEVIQERVSAQWTHLRDQIFRALIQKRWIASFVERRCFTPKKTWSMFALKNRMVPYVILSQTNAGLQQPRNLRLSLAVKD